MVEKMVGRDELKALLAQHQIDEVAKVLQPKKGQSLADRARELVSNRYELSELHLGANDDVEYWTDRLGDAKADVLYCQSQLNMLGIE
jgi:hypothetical protein